MSGSIAIVCCLPEVMLSRWNCLSSSSSIGTRPETFDSCSWISKKHGIWRFELVTFLLPSNILTSGTDCITTWYGNCTTLQPQVSPEGGAVGPTHHRGYTAYPIGHLQHRCHMEAKKDINHRRHCLFTPLPSRRRGQYRCIKAGTERLKNSFYLKAIRLLNSHH